MEISFAYYPEGKKKALTMSYDDGQIYDRKLVEIFNRYGIKGTFHLNSGNLDSDSYLTSSEITSLFKGHEIAVHSLNHPYLTMIPEEVLFKEIIEDRERLEALVSYPVRGMSFPFGEYNQELLKALPAFGIDYSRTVQSSGCFKLPDDFLTWHPSCHHEQNLMDRFEEFKNPKPWENMPLLYVWGHSFEFARNDNWDLIEEFCKAISELDSLWCATNLEIMAYIRALRNLKFSVEQKMVYNPSAISVWIGVEGGAVEIKPGQTVSLDSGG